MNRYAYVRDNPISHNDPSGHDVGCGGKNADCSPYSNVDDKDRQDYLFSEIFRGSGKNGTWTRDDWIYYNDNKNQVWNKPSTWIHPDTETGVKDFAFQTERLATHYTNSEKDDFVGDFSLVFGGISRQTPWPIAAYDVRHGPHSLPFLNEGNEGLDPKYQDSLSPEENQSHHYVGLFFLSYHTGSEIAKAVNFARDSDNPGDINLGNRAALDADLFKNNTTGPLGLSDIITQLLGKK